MEPDAADLSFMPYVLWRRGLLPYHALAPLIPEGTWGALDEREAERVARRDLARRIGDRLHALVPGVAPASRSRMLRLRRDLHNDRLPPPDVLEAVDALLDEHDRAAVRAWHESRVGEERLGTAAATLLANELALARRQLARIASDPHFLAGIQLSGPHLYRSVREYPGAIDRDGQASQPTRLRQTESTIVRYAVRMALRTSPFGAFTEIGANDWHSSADTWIRHERTRLVRLDRTALAWMVSELGRIDGADRVLQLWLNNTARRANGVVEVFARGKEGGGDQSYWSERFVQVRLTTPVQIVVDALADGPRTKADVVRCLTDYGAPLDQASALVERLISAGLCHQGVALPDQTTRVAGAVAARLRIRAETNTGANAEASAAAACADIFDRLQQIEDAFGAATVDERAELLESLAQQQRRFSAIVAAEPPGEIARTLLFEDVAASDPPRTWCPDLIERNRRQFLRLQHVLPAFDDGIFSRLGIYRWFVSCYGERGRCDDLLTAYRAFAQQPPAEINGIMRGANDPAAEDVRAYRRTVLQHLADRVAALDNAEMSLSLDEGEVDDLIAALPAWLTPWTSVSYCLQAAPASRTADPLIVVNSLASGHGIFFSRFCDLVEPIDRRAWSLRRGVSEAIARTSPRQADLTAVLGFNVNLHPALTPLEVVYPGSIASDANALTLRDLALEADPARRTLRLVTRGDGHPIDLEPLNGLLPMAAPLLYRFLCILAHAHHFRVSLWDRLRHWTRREPLHLPRLTLGDLVIERRRWSVPVTDVRKRGHASTFERPDDLMALRQWHLERGLPRESFFRTQPTFARDASSGNWTEESSTWANNVRHTRRKGQYLDFRNPFLVRLLLHQAHTAEDGVVIFDECLPATSLYGERASAEEFLIECQLSGAAPSHDSSGAAK